jgi:hypothetical protein
MEATPPDSALPALRGSVIKIRRQSSMRPVMGSQHGLTILLLDLSIIDRISLLFDVGDFMGKLTVLALRMVLAMVLAGSLFSHAAFRFVDVVFGAVAAASLLTFGLAVILAPGEAVPPGVVLLISGASVMIAGMALIVLVLRALLAQAVARDAEAHRLRTELDEVV